MTNATRSSTSSARSRDGSRPPARASSRSSACSRTSFRARSISPASSAPAGIDGRRRRLPCGGLHAMLPELPPRTARGAGSRHHPVRRRRRRAHRRAPARRRRRARRSPSTTISTTCPTMAAAALPILPRAVVTRVAGHYTSFDAGRGCPFQCSFCTIINVQGRKSRYRTRRRRRGDRARQRRPGRHALLRHRRQFRPQPQLGADPRPADRAARDAWVPASGFCSRSTRSATASRTSSRRRRAPAATRCSSGSRTSTRIAAWARRSARTRSGNIATCCRPGNGPTS